MFTRLLLVAFLLPVIVRADDKALIDQLKEQLRLQQIEAQKNRELAQLAEQKRVEAELRAKVMEDRAARLEQQVAELMKQMAVLQRGGPVRPPRQIENPPTENLNGAVSMVDAEGVLIAINIGSDAGLKVGHTLRVFRLDAKPELSKYLGTMEVLTVREKESVGRMTAKQAKETIRVGDKVASRLQEPEKK